VEKKYERMGAWGSEIPGDSRTGKFGLNGARELDERMEKGVVGKNTGGQEKSKSWHGEPNIAKSGERILNEGNC